MIKGFEDAFMDAQSRTVALCIELLENLNLTVDKVYIYMYQSDIQDFYNAFFKKSGRIYRLNEWFSDDTIDEFLSCGIDDIENIIEVCNAYGEKCPHEFKLIYNVQTKAFDAEYEYEDFMLDDGVGLVQRLEDWVNKCQLKL